ncbi:MAG: GTPase HflX [Phycisphaerales bacterium]|nr:GTPase HflX [Phycisphaerales bacterium]
METDQRTSLSVRRENAILVGVELRDRSVDHDAVDSLRELQALAESAGAIVKEIILQRRPRLDPKFYIGKGKVEELAGLIEQFEADVIIFDDDLSPAQLREIEEVCKCKVLDRSELILDIFASRARTHEAGLQVELAQLEYTAPRLRGMWTHLERIAGAGGGTGVGAVGGIGTRGPGERQIEIDRRIVNRRVTMLKRQIAAIDRRKIQQVRARHEHFNISLVGYTNAGKSTLMNALTDAGVHVEDRLFATLDTKTRRWNLGGADYALLSDTVGFIRRLPHHLVASFRATLEEAIHANLLLHVVDASSPTAARQYTAVTGVLKELGCGDHKTLVVLNKIDAVRDQTELQILQRKLPDALAISAHNGMGLPELIGRVREEVTGQPCKATIRLNNADGRAIAFVEKHAEVFDRRYKDHTVEMDVRIGSAILNRLRENHSAVVVQ